MNCKKCKKEIPQDAIFCPYCGIKQESSRKPKKNGNGLGCVYQLPDKTWRAEITLGYDLIDEKLKRKAKTRSGFLTKKEALMYLPLLRTNPEPLKKAVTFKQLYEQWLPRHIEKVSKSTIDCYRSAYKYFAALYYAEFCQIKTKALQDCVDKCPHGRRTKENMKALATLLFSYAMENDLVNKNYATFIYVKKDITKRRGFFTLEDRVKLWKCATCENPVPNVAYVLCLMYTGFRPNELLSLQKSDYYGDRFVGGSKTTKGMNRIVTISPKIKPLVDGLVACCDSSKDYIFSPTAKKLGDKKFYEIYYKVLQDCAIERKEPYCCRHTFATMMKEVNAPDIDKLELIGHTSMEMTAHYTHTDIDSLKRITNELA